ncbi:hypothetical protein FOA52_016112 [Chlamydomonas sp. UWO 241]|nr:hypothetical protein FOA52_016112 [Chlamydomonas sp. UWO 241]
MESAPLAVAWVPLAGPPSLGAWCPVSNMLAMVGSAATSTGVAIKTEGGQEGGTAPSTDDTHCSHTHDVVLVEPSAPRECYHLEVPAAGTSERIVGLDWSPPGCKRALLVATDTGDNYVWTQEPPADVDGDPAVLAPLPAINVWWASKIGGLKPSPKAPTAAPDPPAAPAAAPAALKPDPDEMPDFFSPIPDASHTATPEPAAETKPEVKAVYAGWLAPPPTLTWNTDTLAAESNLRQPLDVVFQQDWAPPPPASLSAVHHWVRPATLAAVFVSEAATVEFVWGVMGRPGWRGTADGGGGGGGGASTGPLALLPPSHATAPLTSAHAVAGPGNSVRLVLIKKDDPTCVHVIEVNGTPPVSASAETCSVGLHQLKSRALTRLPLPVKPLQEGLVVVAAQLLPSSAGTAFVVLGAAPPPSTALPIVVLYMQTPPAGATQPDGRVSLAAYGFSGPQSWGGVASYRFEGSDFSQEDAAAVGPQCLSLSRDGSKVVARIGSSLHVLCPRTLRPVSVTKLPPLPDPPSAASSSAAGSGATQGGQGVAAACQPAHPLAVLSPNACAVASIEGGGGGLALLRVSLIPDGPPGPRSRDGEVVNKLDAYRLGFSALTGRHCWDVASRVVARGPASGWTSPGETLAKLDVMFTAFDALSAMSHSVLLDRLKLAVLRHVPGRPAAVLSCDLAARCIVRQQYSVVSSLQTVFETGDREKLAEMSSRLPWLSWTYDLLVMMLGSVKRWQSLAPGDPEVHVLPGLRLLQDYTTTQRLIVLLSGCKLKSEPGQSLELVKAAIQVFSGKDVPVPDASQAMMAFTGPYHLHVTRTNRLTSADALKSVLPQVYAHLVPEVGPDELLERAAELGINVHAPGGVGASGGAYNAAAAALVSAWHGWRGHVHTPGTPMLAPTTPPLGSAGEGPAAGGVLAGAASTSDGQWGGGGAHAGGAVAAHAERWARQRDSALHPLGRAAATGSRLVADCALGPRPLLDALSGKRLQWESADVTFEDVDGSFATAELSGDEGGGGGKHGGGGVRDAAAVRCETAAVRKVWRGSCPPSGGMWKRVRMGQ